MLSEKQREEAYFSEEKPEMSKLVHDIWGNTCDEVENQTNLIRILGYVFPNKEAAEIYIKD